MEKMAKELDNRATELDDMSSRTDIALKEMRLQFETMMEMQRQERADMAKLHGEENEKLRKHYGRIILGLILTICLILGTIIGGAIYIFSNFEFTFGTYQDVYSDNNGTATINDGIHFDAAS